MFCFLIIIIIFFYLNACSLLMFEKYNPSCTEKWNNQRRRPVCEKNKQTNTQRHLTDSCFHPVLSFLSSSLSQYSKETLLCVFCFVLLCFFLFCFSCTDHKLKRSSAAVLKTEEQYAQNHQEEGASSPSSSVSSLLMSRHQRICFPTRRSQRATHHLVPFLWQ